MNLLLENIAKHVNLTPVEEERVLSLTEMQTFKARTLLLESAEICTRSFFVNKGILRSYCIDENGVERVLSFASSGWWIADMYSFLSQRPGQVFIEVIDHAEVTVLTKENQEKLYAEVPKMERFFRILIENSLISTQQRLIDNLTYSAEERYELFRKKYHKILPYLPQNQIASYIGVTPEFFSRMKSSLLKK